jgi:hypothetical protein
MKTHYTVALAMVAGFGLGAVAVQGLHAQGKGPSTTSRKSTSPTRTPTPRSTPPRLRPSSRQPAVASWPWEESREEQR